jgi:DnaJ-class molecular chaperone
MSYYDILNVNVDATTDEIRSSYKKLALVYHPDRNFEKKDKEIYEKKFKLLSEAYQILSNSETRKKYDLNNNINIKDICEFETPFDIFSSIFEDIPEEYINISNKFVYELMVSPTNDNISSKILNKIPKTSEIYNIASILIEIFERNKLYAKEQHKQQQQEQQQQHQQQQPQQQQQEQQQQDTPLQETPLTYATSNSNTNTVNYKLTTENITTTIYVKLEEIYNNEIKKIDINRIRKNINNKYVKEKKTFIIPLNKKQIIFANEADEMYNHNAGNIIINIAPQSHPIFKKYRKADLYMEIDVSLYEYYYGSIVSFMFLDEKIITIKNVGNNINKNDTHRIKNLGLPNENNKNNRGDLYIKFVLKLSVLDLNNNETEQFMFNTFKPLNAHLDDLTSDHEQYILNDNINLTDTITSISDSDSESLFSNSYDA